jgi:hypothetical protein
MRQGCGCYFGFPCSWAVNDSMYEAQFSALWGWPTVSDRFFAPIEPVQGGRGNIIIGWPSRDGRSRQADHDILRACCTQVYRQQDTMLCATAYAAWHVSRGWCVNGRPSPLGSGLCVWSASRPPCDSVARRDKPVVIRDAAAVPACPEVSGHPDTHRAHIGNRSRLGAIAVRHTGGRDAAWNGPRGTSAASVKAHQGS